MGAKLAEFRSAARQISSDVTVLIGLISGQSGQDASRALERMLDDSAARNHRLQESSEALATVRDLASRILRTFSHLRQTVSTFRALCTLTRIETATLGGASSGLGNLADEVKPLSESIQASGDVILDASSQLEASVFFVLQHCSDLQDRQRRELPPLIAGVTGTLAALEERRRQAEEVSLQQARQYRQMGEAIEQLVTSLQVHDMTRQQIEHVTHAFEQILGPGPLPAGGPAVLSVQSHQLLSANQVFTSSIGRIESDLESIASRGFDFGSPGAPRSVGR